jgi:hypothetical protein
MRRRRLAMQLRLQLELRGCESGAAVESKDGHLMSHASFCNTVQTGTQQRNASQRNAFICIRQHAGPCNAGAAARRPLSLLQTPRSLLGCYPDSSARCAACGSQAQVVDYLPYLRYMSCTEQWAVSTNYAVWAPPTLSRTHAR